MDSDRTITLSNVDNDLTAAIETAIRFMTTLFDADDLIVIRPVETWLENGRKKSRVDYKNIRYTLARPETLSLVLLLALRSSEENRTNLFFGVCPRFGGSQQFELAWQVRKVRVIWADLDHVTVDEALARCEQSGLPAPSIIVSSGNGVHLYWRLETAYVIDDAEDPPPVFNEFVEKPGGGKKVRKYIVQDGERVYLDQRRHLSRLSAKAEHIQAVVAGVAQQIGGDHTTDISRLLRVPGTRNRKDQRNGAEPKPTALVKCEPTLRYPLATFEQFARPNQEAQRRKQIAQMPLPNKRRLSSRKADKLNDQIAICGMTEAGARSEGDFALCCFAIRHGMLAEELWSQVEHVGKFAEAGRRYFDRTWESAEYEVRAAKFDELQVKERRRQVRSSPPSSTNSIDEVADDSSDHELGQVSRSSRAEIYVTSATPVDATLSQMTDQLLTAKNCFSRAGQLVVVNGQDIRSIITANELAGLMSQHVEFYFIEDEGGEYRPLPANYANTWLNNVLERNRLPAIKLFARHPVFTLDWRLVTSGHDVDSGVYCAGPEVTPQPTSEHLDALLHGFCFATTADRTNYLGILLTAILIPHFIGSKPGLLCNANQSGLGKTILSQLLSILRDGKSADTVSYNPNDEEFEKRLASIVRGGATTIIVDNAKAKGWRTSRIESACLERSLTDEVLSYRLLGYTQDVKAENSHIFCITANACEASPDLVSRCVPVNLYFEGPPERRRFSIPDPEGYALAHRIELLGELVGMVQRWIDSGMPRADVDTRFNKRGWGGIIGGILEANEQPEFLTNFGAAAAAMDRTRRDFEELVEHIVQANGGLWSAASLVTVATERGLLRDDLGEGSDRSRSTRMGLIASRFIGATFEASNGSTVVFGRQDDRKGAVFFVRTAPLAQS